MTDSPLQKTKVCVRCGMERAVDQFYLTGDPPHPQSWCVECSRARSREWYRENRERSLESSRKWRQRNRERYSVLLKKWREEDKEYIKKWREKNKDKLREYNRKWYNENRDELLARRR